MNTIKRTLKSYAVFGMVTLFSGCQLYPDFPMETITETDTQGNYIGNVDPEDWVIKDFQPSDLLEIESWTINTSADIQFLEMIRFCDSEHLPVLKVYPNPSSEQQSIVFMDVVHEKKIIYAFQKSTRTSIEQVEKPLIIDSTETTYTSRMRFVPMNGQFYDTEVLIAFVAADSCAFFTRGDIKIGE